MARPLTEHEQEVRDKRRASHRAVCQEQAQSLRELASRIGVEAELDLEQWATPLRSALLQVRQDPDPASMAWWMARVGHWVAARLVVQEGGQLLLDEDPSAQTFLRSVVGNYEGCGPEGPRHDPFRVAAALVAEGEAPDALFAEIIGELRNYQRTPNSRE